MAPGVVVFVTMAETRPGSPLIWIEAAIATGLLLWGMFFTAFDRQLATGQKRPCMRCIGYDLGLASLALMASLAGLGAFTWHLQRNALAGVPLVGVSLGMNLGTYRHWRSCKARNEPTEGGLSFLVGLAFGLLGTGALVLGSLLLFARS
ncbi:MAG: hypothetical protein QOE90_486 [Thermoplasmata archaeon]|jgi:hypothetical protein|nr:hypothetical protein [Thermoplasmata archaeon]